MYVTPNACMYIHPESSHASAAAPRCHSTHSAISAPSTIRVWMIPSRLFPLLTAFTQQLWSPSVKWVSVPSSTNSPCRCTHMNILHMWADLVHLYKSHHLLPYVYLHYSGLKFTRTLKCFYHHNIHMFNLSIRYLGTTIPLTKALISFTVKKKKKKKLMTELHSWTRPCCFTYCCLNILAIAPNIHGVLLWNRAEIKCWRVLKSII